ncbi:MAG: alcohol dehydrogenase [Firmicutes bacterium HGW-Firmicutes-14]|nr:MAG: alcohol dehydrogenase [Firmicutes bacterium HGW-Firmicutes-14]
MKAALLEGVKDMRITDIPTPKCRKGEVLVRVAVSGICRTDMKAYYLGQRDLRLPRVLGHEITGVVEQIGRGVACVQPGDRVQIAPGLSCGVCPYCQAGLDHLCDRVKVMGFHYDGGFAEFVLIPETGVNNGVLNKIPDHVSFEEAALVEPLACSINMQETASIGLGDLVVIFGAGPLGILNAKLARVRGAGPIILVEKSKIRLASVTKYFDYSVDALEDNVIDRIQEISGGRGVNAVVPCCPEPKAFVEGLLVLAKRGRLCFFSGVLIDSPSPPIDINLIHYKELSVYGAYGCSTSHNKMALELIADGSINVRDMVTLTVPLKEVLSGIELVAGSKETKIVVDMSLST